jgi:hypothetical protein
MIAARTLWEALELVAPLVGVPVDDALDAVLAELRATGATIKYDSASDRWYATLPKGTS